MKKFEGLDGIGMSDRETWDFLTRSKSTLQLATTNSDGTPVIHPVWYLFEPATTKLYFYTEPGLKKAVNIRRRSQVYFCIDSDKWPYKGVKGRGRARLVPSKERALSYGARILAKYVKKGRPLSKSAFDKMKEGGYVIFEITPSFFTSWDFGKLDPDGSLKESIIS